MVEVDEIWIWLRQTESHAGAGGTVLSRYSHVFHAIPGLIIQLREFCSPEDHRRQNGVSDERSLHLQREPRIHTSINETENQRHLQTYEVEILCNLTGSSIPIRSLESFDRTGTYESFGLPLLLPTDNGVPPRLLCDKQPRKLDWRVAQRDVPISGNADQEVTLIP
jgi:hypothetical protein